MKFVFHYPETHGPDGDMLDCGALDEVARAAERAGFDAFSLTEHPAPSARWLAAGGHQSLDPFVALGFVAAATTRLRLLTYLALASYRNPLLLAKSASTLDKLSGGRLILGLGTGYQKSEMRALGIEPDERAMLVDEALDCLPLHWSGEPFSYVGKHFEARDVVALPRPVQTPIPIWIGGNSGAARRRVVEKAQGWMPMMGPPQLAATTQTPALVTFEDVARAIGEVKVAAAAAGRADGLDFLASYHDATIRDAAADVARHEDQLARMAEVGVTWVSLSHPRAEPQVIVDFIERVGATYLRERP